MKRPKPRPKLPTRRSNNDKRRLLPDPTQYYLQTLRRAVRYVGSSKHKKHPHLYGLDPFRGIRGDATLCDRDAGFGVAAMPTVPAIIDRGLLAGLVGTSDMIWGVADDGWIFEARVTLPGRSEYHGYPVRPSEAIAWPVYKRFLEWAENHGSQEDRQAAANCKQRYGY